MVNSGLWVAPSCELSFFREAPSRRCRKCESRSSDAGRIAPAARGGDTGSAFGDPIPVRGVLFFQPSPAVAFDTVDFREDGVDVFFLLEEPRATIGKQREKFG